MSTPEIIAPILGRKADMPVSTPRSVAIGTPPSISNIQVPKPSTAMPIRRPAIRSEEHTSELQSLMRISYAVFCLKKKKHTHKIHTTTPNTPHQTEIQQH